jgi:hypothetical protein
VDDPAKGDVVFVGLHHAREWLAAEMPLRLAEYLLTNYGTDPGLQACMNNLQIWIIPVLNPAQKTNVFMAYGNHEIFVGYKDSFNVGRRQIGHDVYQRWRNDSPTGTTPGANSISAMFFEQDTGQMIVGKDDAAARLQERALILRDVDDDGLASGLANGMLILRQRAHHVLRVVRVGYGDSDAGLH